MDREKTRVGWGANPPTKKTNAKSGTFYTWSGWNISARSGNHKAGTTKGRSISTKPDLKKERNDMASNNSSSGSKKILVPEARAAMNQFKMEAANEVGVNLKKGYNGSMTTREAGSIGGQMVKKMIQSYESNLSNSSAGQE